MGSFTFWQRWLVAVGILLVIAGLGIAFLTGTSLFQRVFDDQINPVYWESKTVDGATQDFQQWVYGVLGATVVGWGVFLAFIAHYPFRQRERWAWTCIAAGVGVWFVIDTYLSLSTGNTFNAFAVNVPLFVLVLVPLWFTRKTFD